MVRGPRLMRETLLIFLRLCLQCAQSDMIQGLNKIKSYRI